MIGIESRSLYEFPVKWGTTKEKTLMIDIAVIRQAYERREICQVILIKWKSNPANAMTQSQFSNQAFEEVMANNYQIEKETLVDRDVKIEGIDHTTEINELTDAEDVEWKEKKTASV